MYTCVHLFPTKASDASLCLRWSNKRKNDVKNLLLLIKIIIEAKIQENHQSKYNQKGNEIYEKQRICM